MQPTQSPKLVLFALLACLAACAPSLPTSIEACLAESEKDAPLPINELQKTELKSRQQAAFYRCMKAKGFKENESYAKQLHYLAFDSPAATGTPDERLAMLNRLRTAEMYRSDRPFWGR